MKKILKRLLEMLPEGRSLLLERWVSVPQPQKAKARVVLSVLTRGGPDAQGKVSAWEFLPTFCNTLRRENFATIWVSSPRELTRVLRADTPVFLINLFGEDYVQISSPELIDLQNRFDATFNHSETGKLLADKLASHNAFASANIPVPKLKSAGGFVRSRFGTGLPAVIIEDAEVASSGDATEIQTDFVDTRVEFMNRQYYTTVRIHCIDDIVLHAYPRARDEQDANPSVHAKDTPLEPALIEYLHEALVRPRSKEFSEIARKLFQLLGHGFYVHDLIIERQTSRIFICESGFKFDDMAYWRHLEPISSDIPSQAILFPINNFAKYSAEIFIEKCNYILDDLRK